MANPVINIKFLADLTKFSTQMQNASRKMDAVSKKMQTVGAGMTAGITLPILALGASVAKSYDVQAKAIAQMETGLKSTGNVVGYTSEQLQKFASDLQNSSLYGDEEILSGVTSQLLTFTNITGEQFKKTSQLALDLSTRLGTDLKSSSIQLGKALNDPVANLSALSRSGIQFSEDQKQVINALAEGGRMAEAQNIILAELERQYGGSAAAAAEAGTGGFKQLANIIGDIGEDFGKIIVEYLKPFVARLKEMALQFQNVSPQAKKFIVIIAGIAAAIGPLLALAGTILPAISTGFALLTGPIGLVVGALAAVGTIIYKYWDPIKATLVDIANYFIDLYNESTVFRLGVEAISTSFKNIYAVGEFVFSTLGNLISLVASNIKESFTDLGKIIKAVLTGNIELLPGIMANALKKSMVNVGDFVDQSKTEFAALQANIKNNIVDGIDAGLNGRKHKILAENVDASEVEKATASAVVKGLGGSGGGVADQTPQLNTVATSSAGLASVTPNNSADTLTNKMAFFSDADVQMAEFEIRLQEFQASTGEIMQSVAENFVTGFADVVAGIASGSAGFGEVGGLLLSTLADLTAQLGKAAIKIGLTMKAIKMSFANPLAAIAAGGALLVVSGLLKSLSSSFSGSSSSVEGFADGGIVGGSSFYGDKILARLNSGELILNQDQQKNLNTLLTNDAQQTYIPETKLRGEDIVISYKRAEKRTNRLG